MTTPKILAIATVTPLHYIPQSAIVAQADDWLQSQDSDFRMKALRILKNADVAGRYTVLPIDQVFAPMSLDEKNAVYRDKIVDYAEDALRQALDKAGLRPTDIDCIITTSCTGHMSPSLDAFLVNRLDMKPGIQRLPVMEMGCIGGVAGLIYAENYLRAYPDRKVALIAAELTSITFQRDDFSWANIVSTAIFGDGIACAILGASPELKPAINASGMFHFPESTHLLGFNLSGTGFRMVLDESLPATIQENFEAFLSPVLHEANTRLEDIRHFMVHPGGKVILKHIQELLPLPTQTLDDSWAVLRALGNVSSATVLFIAERFLARAIPEGEKALMLGFGPGLTAAGIVMTWEQ